MAIVSEDRQDEYFDEKETMSHQVRGRYLARRLAEAIDHAYRHAPTVKEKMDKAGVSPAEIRSIKDLEKLPVTSKVELIELQKTRPPYGGFLTIPPKDVERIFVSPGPIYEPLHSAYIKWFAKPFYAAGFRKGDIVINTFTYHLSPAGMLFHEAIRDCGATVVVAGTGSTENQLQIMRDMKVTGFVGTPSFLMTTIKKAEEMGHDFKRDYHLKRAWFTGEMLPASLRNIFEEDYQIATSQAYAVTELGGAIAYECRQKEGMHFMDEYIVEIVDPETGKQLGPGEIGEIVVTPVHNRAWGLVRFGTGDMSSYTNEPCPCGRTASRLVSIVGRTGDAVKVRGMFVIARQAEQVILGFEAVNQFQIVVRRPAQRDEMTANIELKDESADRDKLASDLNKSFQSLCRVKFDRIEFVEKGSIPDQRQVILDERSWA